MKRRKVCVCIHSFLSVGLFVFIRIWIVIRFLDLETQRAAIEILKKPNRDGRKNMLSIYVYKSVNEF